MQCKARRKSSYILYHKMSERKFHMFHIWLVEEDTGILEGFFLIFMRHKSWNILAYVYLIYNG